MYRTKKNFRTYTYESYTYKNPLADWQIERHRQFKGAHGNLSKNLRTKDLKNLVKDILKGLEVCDCPVETSIALVKKYVDSHWNNDVWKEIYSLARNITSTLPMSLSEEGPF
jgi:hypothetical protein